MGGRKGYSLKRIVGDTSKVKSEQKELLRGIEHNNPKKVAQATAGILAKSDTSLESLAHSFLFVGNIKEKEYKRLSKQDTKERRKELAKKWAEYREEKGKQFDAPTNRDVVDSATRVLGGTR
jgi:uridine kinase